MIVEGYSVSELTKAAGITRQAYYKWLKHKPSKREIEESEIFQLIKQLENEHKQSVGYDKMTRLINLSQQISYNVNKKRIIRIMKEHGIKADYRQPTRKRIQTQQAYEAENILKRQFNQTAANQVWVTDTTEITYGVRLNKVRLHVGIRSIWPVSSKLVNYTY